jgi:ABC-2 type transport system permease protein
MMKFIDIALKDLYQIFKDWKSSIFLIIAPILFTLMFGFMFGGISDPEDADNRLLVRVIAHEHSPIAESFLNYLEESQVVRVEEGDSETPVERHRQAVADGDAAAVLLIPEGFSQKVREEGQIPLEVVLDENTSVGLSIQQEIQSAVARLKTASDAASLAVDVYEKREGFADNDERNTLYVKAFDEMLNAWQNPPVGAVERQTSPDGGQTALEDNAFAHSLPGMMAQFAIAGLIGAAEIVVQERKSDVLDRLRSTAVSKYEILAGHWLAMFGMIFLQFIVLVAFGQIFLRLDFLNAPMATLALSTASCAFVASLGLLIGFLAKMPEQTSIYALIPMFLFAGLGGAWVPMEFLGETVQKVSRFTPVAWIMSGFKDILLRGAGLSGVWMPTLILFGFSALFLMPAVILFYRRES